MIQAKLINSWTLVLIASCLIHMQITAVNISGRNKDLVKQETLQGYATLLSWFCLNAYLVTYKQIAFIPNTFAISSKAVFNGLVGIFPFAFGVAVYTTSQLYSYFRFITINRSLFTMFYVMNGDTVFDSFYGAYAISPWYGVLWGFGWVWFSINVILNITLAQLEESFL